MAHLVRTVHEDQDQSRTKLLSILLFITAWLNIFKLVGITRGFSDLKKNKVSLSERITNLNHKLSNISNNNLYPSNCNEEQWVCNGINDSKFILIECKTALKKCIIVSRLRTIYTYKVTFSVSPLNTFLGSDVRAGFSNSVLKIKTLVCLLDMLENELL